MAGEMMLFPDTVEEFIEQYKVVDSDHALSNGAEFIPVFRMRQWFDHLQAQPITNADRIRTMTDEELADWLKSIRYSWTCVPKDNGNRCSVFKDDCNACWLDWLKQEAG